MKLILLALAMLLLSLFFFLGCTDRTILISGDSNIFDTNFLILADMNILLDGNISVHCIQLLDGTIICGLADLNIGGSIVDTNWETSWPIFDANMKAYYLLKTDANEFYALKSDVNFWGDIRYVPYTGALNDVNLGYKDLSVYEINDLRGHNNIVVDLRLLYDSVGHPSLDWNTRILADLNGSSAIQWGNRFLVNSDGNLVASWVNRLTLNDSMDASGESIYDVYDLNATNFVKTKCLILGDGNTFCGLADMNNGVGGGMTEADANLIYVPYDGAIRDVNLGNYELISKGLTTFDDSQYVGLKITGAGYAGGGSLTEGVALFLGYNAPTNRQLWITFTDSVGLNNKSAFRYIAGDNLAGIDAVRADGSDRLNLSVGTVTSDVGIGVSGDYNMIFPGKLTVYGEDDKNVLALIGSASSLNFLTLENSSGELVGKIDSSGDMNMNTIGIDRNIYIKGGGICNLDGCKSISDIGTGGTGSIVDTNWETSWPIFDANMKAYYLLKTDLNKDINAALSIQECGVGYALQKLGGNLTCVSITSGAVSPLTTKGDIWVYSTEDTNLSVGPDGYFLKADSSTATGLIWATTSAVTGNWAFADSNLEHDANTAADAIIKNKDQDKDILFEINDGGTTRTALQINGENGTITLPRQSAVRVTLSDNQSVAQTGAVILQFNTETFDVLGEWNSGTYTFTATEAGKYLACVQGGFVNTAAVKIYRLMIYVNGGLYTQQIHQLNSTAAGQLNLSECDLVNLAAGGTIAFYARHDSAAAVLFTVNASALVLKVA